MKLFRNLAVVLAVLAATGLAMHPLESRLVSGMRDRGLLQEPLSLETREDLGITGLAIALGGLRSLIASMLNLRAHEHWQNQRWFELAKTYQTATALQPQTRYYWEVASWHLVSNAYADYEDKPGVPEGRRRELQQQFFEKGMAFLEEAVRRNPDDWRLWAALGHGHSQTWRPQDLSAAADAYRRAAELSGSLQMQRQHLYSLCRVAGREAEAWEAAQAVWANPHNRRFPSTRSIFFAMQEWAAPPPAERIPLEEIFGGRRETLLNLADYWPRQRQGYPMHGIAPALEELSREFRVPERLDPLRQPIPKWISQLRGPFRTWVLQQPEPGKNP